MLTYEKKEKTLTFGYWESLPTGKMGKAGGVRELMLFRVVSGHTKGLAWLLQGKLQY